MFICSLGTTAPSLPSSGSGGRMCDIFIHYLSTIDAERYRNSWYKRKQFSNIVNDNIQ